MTPLTNLLVESKEEMPYPGEPDPLWLAGWNAAHEQINRLALKEALDSAIEEVTE